MREKWSDKYVFSTVTDLTSFLALDRTMSQSVTSDTRWLSDKLIQTKLAVQPNKTPCIRGVALIRLKTEVTDRKYILKWNVVTRKNMTKLTEETTCGEFVSG